MGDLRRQIFRVFEDLDNNVPKAELAKEYDCSRQAIEWLEKYRTRVDGNILPDLRTLLENPISIDWETQKDILRRAIDQLEYLP